MTEMQEKLCQMLGWFQEYCQENEFTYFISYGTFLGAVRHGGFIPWDDDIDILMPRPDYNRLMTSFQETERYCLETPYSDAKDYQLIFCKLFDKTTTFYEKARVSCLRGIFLDIFPLDGAGNTEKEVRQTFRRIKPADYFLLLRTRETNPDFSFLKNAAICLSRILPFVSEKRLIKRLDKKLQRKPYETSQYVGNLLHAASDGTYMAKEVYGAGALYRFENIEVVGPEQGERFLELCYGDWRTLPPEEKRVGHDAGYVNLHQPYKEADLKSILK